MKRRSAPDTGSPLEYCGGDLLHLDRGKYQRIDVRRFRINPELSVTMSCWKLCWRTRSITTTTKGPPQANSPRTMSTARAVSA